MLNFLKKTKFVINKYHKKKPYVLTNDENYWLTTLNNSCRYDAFISMFALSIKQNKNPFVNTLINDLIDIITKIIIEKNENYKFEFWKKLIDSKIDIDESDKDGFNKMGFIAKLFTIFKENEYYCIKERKRLHCNKCNKDFIIKEYTNNPLIEIQKEYLEYDSINTIYIDKQFSDDIELCPICSKKNNFSKKTCNIYYDIISKPAYLFFILDIESDELCEFKDNILNIFTEEIVFDSNIYSLSSIICFKNRNHFTTFIWKLDSWFLDLFENKFNTEFHYYHDGGVNSGIIHPIDSINLLYNKLYAYPYIFIYKKKE